MTIQIFEQLHPVPHDRNRFRILETYESCDGTRTRVSDKSFPSYDAAMDFVDPNRPKPAHRLEEDENDVREG